MENPSWDVSGSISDTSSAKVGMGDGVAYVTEDGNHENINQVVDSGE